jgi:hypothetical protein
MDPAKQKFTKPLRVATVRGLEANTVLPPAAIQPVVGFYVR